MTRLHCRQNTIYSHYKTVTPNPVSRHQMESAEHQKIGIIMLKITNNDKNSKLFILTSL